MFSLHKVVHTFRISALLCTAYISFIPVNNEGELRMYFVDVRKSGGINIFQNTDEIK